MTGSRDSDYMTEFEFLTRLRKDLHSPEFHAVIAKAPESEEEYLRILSELRNLFAKIK